MKHNQFTPEKKKEFLERLAMNALNITRTCNDLGMNKQPYYYALQYDQDFREKVERLKDNTNMVLYDIIMDGLTDPKNKTYFLKLFTPAVIDRIMFGKKFLDSDNQLNINISKDDIQIG